MTCSKCGGEVLPTGRCSQCGHDVNVDLEIAAFMTPHINRARIVLVGLGILFIYVGWRDYGAVAEAKHYVDRAVGVANDADIEEARSLVNMLYALVVFTLGAGVVNIALAAIAGKKTMIAFNVAVGLFVLHTGFLIYASGGAFVTTWWWWIAAICLGMGYTAARKAEHLRRGTPPGPTPTPF